MDETTLLMFLAVLPIALILSFVYSKDYSKEPVKLLLSLFGLGIISCGLVLLISRLISNFIPVFGAELIGDSFIGLFIYAFFRVALLEELCKWLMLYLRGYNSKEFDESYDIIVYSVFVSLGFAFLENILFIIFSGRVETVLLRAILSVPGHACFGIFMGYFLSIAKEYQVKNNRKKMIEHIILSIVIPMTIHGIYDFCLMSKSKILIIVFIMFIIFIYIIAGYRLRRAIKSNKIINKNKDFCPECGAKLSNNKCHKCKERQD